MNTIDLNHLVTRLRLQPTAWNGLCLESADELVKQRAEIVRLREIITRLSKACLTRNFDQMQVFCGDWELEQHRAKS